MDFTFLILGLAGLWFGTEVTIRGAIAIANRYGVSEFIVGVVILSIGSDLPELAVAIDAKEAVHFIGRPEGDLALAEAAVAVAAVAAGRRRRCAPSH